MHRWTKVGLLLFIVGFAFFTAGCEEAADVVGDITEGRDTRLVGTWNCITQTIEGVPVGDLDLDKIVFRLDGSGTIYEDDGDRNDFTWSNNDDQDEVRLSGSGWNRAEYSVDGVSLTLEREVTELGITVTLGYIFNRSV